MKIVLSVILLFSVILSYAQEVNGYSPNNYPATLEQNTNNSGSKLDSIYYFSSNNCWIRNNTEKYIYDSQNLFEKKTYNNGILITKDSCIYDGASRLIKKYQINYNSSDGKLINKYINFYSYDAGDKLLLIVTNDSTTTDRAYHIRDSIVYDANLMVYRERYGYSGGTIYNINYNEWKYNVNNQKIEFISGTINNSIKTLINKEEYEYSNNLLYKISYYTWNLTLLKWDISSKDSLIYDKRGNLVTKYKYYFPIYMNTQVPQYQIETQYSSENLPVSAIQYNWQFYYFKESIRTVYFYSNSQNSTTNWSDLCGAAKFSFTLNSVSCPSSISERQIKNPSSISVFPNPNNGVFSVKFLNKNQGKYRIYLYSGSGKLIYNEEIKVPIYDFTKEINIPGLTDGIYYLQILSGNNMYQEKISVYTKK